MTISKDVFKRKIRLGIQKKWLLPIKASVTCSFLYLGQLTVLIIKEKTYFRKNSRSETPLLSDKNRSVSVSVLFSTLSTISFEYCTVVKKINVAQNLSRHLLSNGVKYKNY